MNSVYSARSQVRWSAPRKTICERSLLHLLGEGTTFEIFQWRTELVYASGCDGFIQQDVIFLPVKKEDIMDGLTTMRIPIA